MNGYCRILVFAFLLMFTAQAPTGWAQSSIADASNADLAEVHGIVCNRNQGPLGGVEIYLDRSGGGVPHTMKATTDENGAFKFIHLVEGGYVLRAETLKSGETASAQFSVGPKESKRIDLIFEDGNSRAKPISSSPEFFDEPHFTVAGVTDTTDLGGHGSSAAGNRNKEELAKAIAALANSTGEKPSVFVSNNAKEKSLREAVKGDSQDFEANYQLGDWLLDEGNVSEGTYYLEQAHEMKPKDFDAAYKLASAYFSESEYGRARTQLLALAPQKEQTHQNAELHHLLGQIDERLNDPLQAVREFQRAAEDDPSEQDLFDWGSELLLHRAAEPAAEVFTKGHRLYQNSVRMLTALGATWYELGFYEKAAATLGEASDLDPLDVDPYLVMGKIQAVDGVQSETIAQRLQRFMKIYPDNALASYYCAVSLMKGERSADGGTRAEAESLLWKSVKLDPKLGEAYLQLGILYVEESDFAKAISYYQQAIVENAHLEQAHYRLAQAYRRIGEDSKAQLEMQTYEKISKQKAEETERERRQVQRFVYRWQGEKSVPPR
jgi:tetratricopeptide (TPR) repeat protein